MMVLCAASKRSWERLVWMKHCAMRVFKRVIPSPSVILNWNGRNKKHDPVQNTHVGLYSHLHWWPDHWLLWSADPACIQGVCQTPPSSRSFRSGCRARADGNRCKFDPRMDDNPFHFKNVPCSSECTF